MEHINWDVPVAIDLFTAGLGAAMFMVAAIANIIDDNKDLLRINTKEEAQQALLLPRSWYCLVFFS